MNSQIHNSEGKNFWKLNINKKYLNKKGRPFSVSLPKEIKLFSEVAGLIVGEGFIGDRTFIFANSNEKAIDEVLDFLKQFNFPIKMYLEISVKNKPKIFKDQSKNFWENYLKIKIKRVRLRKTASLPVQAKTAKHHSLSLTQIEPKDDPGAFFTTSPRLIQVRI